MELILIYFTLYNKLSSFLKVLLKLVFNSNVTYEPVTSDPFFHKLNDGKDTWGIKFFDIDSSEEFRKRIGLILSEYHISSDKITSTSNTPPSQPNMIPPQPSTLPSQPKIPLKKAPLKKMPQISKNPPPLPKTPPVKSSLNNTRHIQQNSLSRIPKGFVSQQQNIL